MRKRFTRVLTLLLSFSLFDALIGGGISAAMSGEWNQTVNNVYQAGFGLIIAITLLITWFVLKWKREVIALLILLFGLVEDTLFYLLIPIANPFIRILTHGLTFTASGGGLFPPRISGWLGWIGRVLGEGNNSLSMEMIFLMNGISVLLAIILLWKRRSRTKQNAA